MWLSNHQMSFLTSNTAILRSATPLSPPRQPKDLSRLFPHTQRKECSRRRPSLPRLSQRGKLTPHPRSSLCIHDRQSLLLHSICPWETHLRFHHRLYVRQSLPLYSLRPADKSTLNQMIPSMTCRLKTPPNKVQLPFQIQAHHLKTTHIYRGSST
ncbi:hypothetical protein E4U14_003105 [Claviceps sp. LM454 group G7]|nr:hypothetical protein E4U14_003105 [Claviceps sp. LM454 group G7]